VLRHLERLLPLPGLGDLPPHAPGSDKTAAIDDPEQAIGNASRVPVEIAFVRFKILNTVAGIDEGAQERHNARIGSNQRVRQMEADKVLGLFLAIHPREGVVALSKVGVTVQTFDYFVFRQRDRDGPGFLTAKCYGAVLNERPIVSLARPQ